MVNITCMHSATIKTIIRLLHVYLLAFYRVLAFCGAI